jgi:hypothetical protein
MDSIISYPATFALALAATAVWALGNYKKKKYYVYIGVMLTAGALACFILGI